MEGLARAIPDREPSRYLYDLVRQLVQRPGKGLRPGLVMATAGAYGAPPSQAVPSAAGLEMLHAAFLVHDDVEDASVMRRGAPTLHRLVGVPLAVNAGDAMNTLSMRLFRENVGLLGPQAAARIFDEVDHLLSESLEGQALELGWIRDGRTDIAVDDYLVLVLKKTAWYSFIHPMRIGAIVARPDDDGLDRFHRLGFLLGAAFQIHDDVLNLVGRPDAYGKEIGGDLWEGKRTLVTAHALERLGPHDRRRLTSFLERPRSQRLDREVLDVHDLLTGTGSIEWAADQARQLAQAALAELPRAFSGARPGPDLDFVRSLAEHVASRSS
jgi:geranylgeranyl pyrophosphate synthase